jgi:hypothetical protein
LAAVWAITPLWSFYISRGVDFWLLFILGRS